MTGKPKLQLTDDLIEACSFLLFPRKGVLALVSTFTTVAFCSAWLVNSRFVVRFVENKFLSH